MNINEENSTIKETNVNNKVNNKKSYHQSTTPYKNYQHRSYQHKTPNDKFHPLGFSSPYDKSNNPETSGSTSYNNQFKHFNDGNRNNYKNNRNNHNRNSKNGCREENISQYFHPSMLEDPWKKLEDRAHKVKQKSPESSAGDSSPSST